MVAECKHENLTYADNSFSLKCRACENRIYRLKKLSDGGVYWELSTATQTSRGEGATTVTEGTTGT